MKGRVGGGGFKGFPSSPSIGSSLSAAVSSSWNTPQVIFKL